MKLLNCFLENKKILFIFSFPSLWMVIIEPILMAKTTQTILIKQMEH